MARLGDICTLVNGYAFKPTDWKTEGFPIIRIQNLNDTTAPFNYFEGEIENKYVVNDGDLLFSWSGTPGTSFGAFFWRRGKGVLNQHIFNVYPVEGVTKEYLRYALNGNIGRIIDKAHGGVGLQHITKKELVEIDIPILSEDQQKQIVTVLDSVDKLIASRNEQLAKLDQLVKSRFIELFGDPVACKNKRKLSEIGKVFTGNTPSMKEPSYYESNDIPFIKPNDLNESGVTSIGGVEAYISEKARPVARIIPPDAVLVTCIGTIGKIGMTARESCCNQQINYVIPNDGINSVYLAYCLTFFKSTLQNIANAPVVPIINKTQFSKLEVPVFDTAKQNQFAAFVEQTDKSKFDLKQSLEKLETLKKSLMQQYFG